MNGSGRSTKYGLSKQVIFIFTKYYMPTSIYCRPTYRVDFYVPVSDT